MRQAEQHRTQRIGWLRAAVLGANDGIVSASLIVVVTVSFGLQVWSQHHAILGRILKTSYMPFTDCLLLLTLGSIPLLVLEGVKMVRRAR